MYFLITHMGTMLSVRELIAQWKTLVISIFGICGICIGTLLLGQLFFSWDMLVVATPPLTGGVVASIIMSEAAKAKGLEPLSKWILSLPKGNINEEAKKYYEYGLDGTYKAIKKESSQQI